MIPKFQELPKLDINPISYYNILQDLNRLIHLDLRKKMSALADTVGNMATITLPGSDGRKENSNSEFEVITIFNDNSQGIPLSEMQDVIKSSLGQIGINQIEFKNPGSVLSYYNNDSNIVQPGRIADSQQLIGNEENLATIKKKAAEELMDFPSSKIERIDGLVRSAKKSILDGGKNRIGGQDRIHYNLDEGYIVFDPSAMAFSFKIGPLRLVQNTVLLQQIKKIRRDRTTELFTSLPTGIIPKIEQLKDDGKLELNRETISEIADIYAFFLKLYHRSEVEYNSTGKTIIKLEELGLNMKEEISKRLIRLLDLMKAFKIT